MDMKRMAAVSNVAGMAGQRTVLLPPCSEVAAVLKAGIKSTRFTFPENGQAKKIEVWEPPAVADKATGMAIWSRLQELEEFMAPAEPGPLMSRVLVLLSHYRQTNHSEAVEQGIADDWADDLESYPMWAIDAAARQWRRTKKFKPQIAEILELCQEASKCLIEERDRLRSIIETTRASQNPLVERTRALARSMLKVID